MRKKNKDGGLIERMRKMSAAVRIKPSIIQHKWGNGWEVVTEVVSTGL